MRAADPAPWLERATAALVLVLVALCVWRTQPPRARDGSAPPDQFSAARAVSTLRGVLIDDTPHPTGTPENARVRGRIVAQLVARGLAPEVEQSVVCGRYGVCAEVSNIIAKRPGRGSGGAILLAAHYDSVGAAPGASDDGLGVAVLLETARALQRDPTTTHPVIFLFTDGEEAGLLGAEAFVASRPVADEVAVVLNVEARGTGGPALMFETSDGNAKLVSAFARASPRPLASSLFSSVYRRLPNDTDLTVFKRAGVAGLNFGSIAGAQRYHTPRDDLAHVSADSVQHHGDNLLALTRALATSERPQASADDAVFFDVLAFGIISWPKRWAQPVTGIIAALALLALALSWRSGELRLRGWLSTVAVWPLVPIGAALLAFGSFALLGAVGRSAPWPAHPSAFVALVTLAGLLPGTLSLRLRPGDFAWQEWSATITWWTLLSLGVTLALAEASFLFVGPTAVLALTGILAAVFPTSTTRAVALVAPLAAALLLWLPVLLLAYDAVGLQVPSVMAAAVALVASPALAIAARLRKRIRTLALVSLAAAFVVMLGKGASAPMYSPESPQRLSFALHHDADSQASRWLVDASSGDVPPSVVSAGGFATEVVDPSPWLGGWQPAALAAPAPPQSFAPPQLENVRTESVGSRRRISGRLRSARGARLITLHFEQGSQVRDLRIAGRPATLRPAGRSSTITYLGDTSAGVEVELTCSARLDVVISDHERGLPASADGLLASRPASAVASQWGDVTVVSRRLEL